MKPARCSLLQQLRKTQSKRKDWRETKKERVMDVVENVVPWVLLATGERN